MIKILVVGLSEIYGGIENYINNVVNNIDLDKFSFDFLNFSDTKIAFEDNFVRKGFNIIKISGRKKNYIKYRNELIELYKNSNYDIIHFHVMSFEAFERIKWAIKYTSAKIIVHSHNAGFGSNAKLHTRMLHYFGKVVLKHKKFYKVACGEDAGKWLYKAGEYEILNNGINYEKYKFDLENRNKIRKNLNIKDGEIVIGHTGRLEVQKNHDFLVDIYYEYYKNNVNSKLVLVGDGNLREKLEKKVNDLNIANNVIFVGFTKNVNEYYSAFDIFCLPSLFEGLSISLVEAQVNGLKCFCSTNIDKTSDITGNIYFLSLKESPKYWANKMISEDIKRDKDVLKNINKDYFIENSIKKLEKYYINICK